MLIQYVKCYHLGGILKRIKRDFYHFTLFYFTVPLIFGKKIICEYLNSTLELSMKIN